MVIMMMPLMIVMMIVMMMMMFGMVPTMHKEAVTLTDASRTKSDGSASLLVFSSDKFSIVKTVKFFLWSILNTNTCHQKEMRTATEYNVPTALFSRWKEPKDNLI